MKFTSVYYSLLQFVYECPHAWAAGHLWPCEAVSTDTGIRARRGGWGCKLLLVVLQAPALPQMHKSGVQQRKLVWLTYKSAQRLLQCLLFESMCGDEYHEQVCKPYI